MGLSYPIFGIPNYPQATGTRPALLVPLPADRLMMYEVSPKVNSPAFNVPEALQPVASE